MEFEKKMLESQSLTKRVEFITIQSSERREEEVRYKNINRKQIRFDLSDVAIMLALGEILRPYGVMELIENKLAKSNIEFFRYWGEKRLAKRGQSFMMSLYMKSPEKFAQAELKSKGRKQMELARGTLIISELTNQKTISLQDNKDDYHAELEEFREKFKEQEMKLRHQKDVIEELTHDGSDANAQKLIGSNV
ncbi:hypothetical protein [Simkania sp.]|uniref:hypothetical protein n=1 Tax=Simkania sp. TaxID=34094 RepID=UPI003B52ECD8